MTVDTCSNARHECVLQSAPHGAGTGPRRQRMDALLHDGLHARKVRLQRHHDRCLQAESMEHCNQQITCARYPCKSSMLEGTLASGLKTL